MGVIMNLGRIEKLEIFAKSFKLSNFLKLTKKTARRKHRAVMLDKKLTIICY